MTANVILSDITSFLERLAPPSIALSWDNPGLQAGDPGQAVRGILLSLDMRPEIIVEARKLSANLVITHHPLIFGQLKRVDLSTPVGGMIGELLKNGIAHYAAHTNLDRSFLGPGRILANILGLQRVDRYTRNPADEMNMVFTGSFCPPRPWDEVLGTLKAATGSKSVRLTGNPVTVGSAAIVPGSGGSLIRRISRPFDLIVTGEISYHDALLAEQGGQAVAALGHYYSEKPAMLHLASLIGEKYPQIPVFVAGSEGEPYRSL